MKRIDKIVIMIVALFVALALLKTTLEIAAGLAPFVAGIGAIYLIGRLWTGGKLEFVKVWASRMMKPAPEPAERK
jgi:hypothetical protein